MAWKRIDRKAVFNSKFLKVYQDRIELPNGDIINDYTVVEKPSIVMIVATDHKGDVLILHEYKYAANQTLLTLPSGHIKDGESPVGAAERELLEETGYQAKKYNLMSAIYDYPSKDLHTVYVVRAYDIEQAQKTDHEKTEEISFELIDRSKLKEQVKNKEWKITSAIAALAICGIIS